MTNQAQPSIASNTNTGKSPLTLLDRRNFVKTIGAGAAALATVKPWQVVAGPFDPQAPADHWVPADKKLSPEWIKTLYAKGERTWYTGADLKTIGMPVGGIGAGQVYLSSDGRLIYWDVMNRNHNTGYGAINYKVGRLPTEVASPGNFSPALQVAQGFALQIEREGKIEVRALDSTGFPKVRFCGEHPIGNVEYADANFPIETKLQAIAPFVPLNAEDSALPTVFLRYILKNTSQAPVKVTLAGWLQNQALALSAEHYAGQAERVNEAINGPGYAGFMGRVEMKPAAPKPAARPPVVFADFEGDNYGGWTVEGEAFGTKPAGGTLANQQNVSGFKGKGLVNTFLGGSDQKQGRLLSPEFKIERPYISFLVGGGSQQERTGVNLLVDGKAVRRATGKDNERLEPCNWAVTDLIGKTARIEIVDREGGPWGHINVDQIEFRDTPLGPARVDFQLEKDCGSMGLILLEKTETSEVCAALPEGELPQSLFAGGRLATSVAGRQSLPGAPIGAVASKVTVRPAEVLAITFAVVWHFPNMYFNERRVGNRYAAKFKNGAEIAAQVATKAHRIMWDTVLWHDTYYRSTLPYWLLDRVHSTASYLATCTSQWWEDGRFWAWEGCGCCHGTCGHVWNYAHTMARLFPELERAVREHQDFLPQRGFQEETGAIGFRGEGWGLWAGDSQGGYILKAWREHLCSADSDFLKRNWPRIKKATHFLIKEDANDDGLIEGKQHQTYDENYFGANTFVGALYLGALRAAEEMAKLMGDTEFAGLCKRVFEAGRENSVKQLFNGEYYIQKVDLKQHPDWQYADGCLADQMFGQCWAHQVGLGYLYPPETVRKALESVWKYCWAPDIGPQNQAHKPERWFALAGEAGLFTCTWPKSPHLGPKSTRYRDEIWTGIEYQVASHMVSEGMITEALAICRAIHERYHPAKRNPWNEIECGDHYARAMASWGMITALSGFEYNGPAGLLGFAPKITPENFQCAFTAAEGWGNLIQKREARGQYTGIAVIKGRLRLNTVKLSLPKTDNRVTFKVSLNLKPLEVTADPSGMLKLPDNTVVSADQSLEVYAQW